jgi:hypothetical protein
MTFVLAASFGFDDADTIGIRALRQRLLML